MNLEINYGEIKHLIEASPDILECLRRIKDSWVFEGKKWRDWESASKIAETFNIYLDHYETQLLDELLVLNKTEETKKMLKFFEKTPKSLV